MRALRHRGIETREIRKLNLPSESGGGAGEQYVREHYAREVQAARAAGRTGPVGLVVHIDADPTHTVRERHAQLAAALRDAGEKPRQPGEHIAELVPKRNIETWIYALDGSLGAGPGPLDEAKAYPKLGSPRACATAAETFADHARLATIPAVAKDVPSLKDGLEELRRLP